MASFKSMFTSQQIVTLNSIREKAVYTAPFSPTLNTEYENIIMNNIMNIFSQVLSWSDLQFVE